MSDSLGKIFSILIAVFILFIFPIKNELEVQDNSSRLYVFTETSRFVDSVRNLGYITPSMYEDFTIKISNTGNIYEIDMTHYSKRYDPIYDDPTDKTTFKNDFNINYIGTYNYQIMDELFPRNSVGTSYEMSRGDFFQVKVHNTNKTLATRIQEFIYNMDLPSAKISVNYGGMILDEDY